MLDPTTSFVISMISDYIETFNSRASPIWLLLVSSILTILCLIERWPRSKASKSSSKNLSKKQQQQQQQQLHDKERLFLGRRHLKKAAKAIRRKHLVKLARRQQDQRANGDPSGSGSTSSDSLLANQKNTRTTGGDFAITVAIAAHSKDVPLNTFCLELNQSLSAITSVLLLNSDKILEQFGSQVFEKSQEYKLSSWLSQHEVTNRLVIYQCDPTLTAWTRRCFRQADCILSVALAGSSPSLSEAERELEHSSSSIQKELVLLHPDPSKKPSGTLKWLELRPWSRCHHHIRCPRRMFVKDLVEIDDIYSTLLNRSGLPIDNDFARLARYLTKTSIGIVLGGGGARGAAHLGMIKAIREAGIPIDIIGGVSIGAFMGGLWAQETDLNRVTEIARSWALNMVSLWSTILDLTYPITAMFTGASFNKTIRDVFGERQIEDLWLPYFTVTTDITSSAARVHRRGSLWRYVRSSMSLSGYLPPLCDPVDGHLLLDGGYVNNLPADVMHNVMNAHIILAVDVGSQDQIELTNYGDTLSGWWLLWNKWNPFGQNIRVPSLPEIQSRLAYVSCVRHLELIKRKHYCKYMRPPIDDYKSLQFGYFNEILEVGYKFGSQSNLSDVLLRKSKPLCVSAQ